MPPEPPTDVPNYVLDGIDRQGPETLRSIVDYCRDRIEFLESSVALEDDDVAEEEELVDVTDDGKRGTRVIKRVPCGKDCGGCPHGPYEYRVTRDGEDLNWDYLGRVENV